MALSEQSRPAAGAIPVITEAAAPRLTGRWRRMATIAWLLVAAVAVIILVTALPGYLLTAHDQMAHGQALEPSAWRTFFGVLARLASLFSALLAMGLSLMFFRRRFEETAAAALSFYLMIYAVVMAGPIEFWTAYWLNDASLALPLQGVLLAFPTVALLLLFPNGRFAPGYMRWMLLLAIPWTATLVFIPIYDEAFLQSLSPAAQALLFIWYGSFIVAGLASQVYRYRRQASPVERQQLKWVVFGFALWIGYMVLSSLPYFYLLSLPAGSPEPWWSPASTLGWFLSLSIMPVCLAIAVTRYRLWDIDLIINRALVYGLLTAVVLTLYALVVGGLAALFQTQANWPVALIATGLIAVLFQPLRQRLQARVNRLVYGQRDEPLAVISHLGRQLETTLQPQAVYTSIVETAALTLKLPYAGLAVAEGDEMVVVEQVGLAATEPVIFPLTHQGQLVGELRVGRRAKDQALNPTDERLLRQIARQAGAAVHAVHLTAALQHSRQRLVTAREEERRRLRRDLHDGLGPTLAAQMLKIGSARALLTNDPPAAGRLLAELEADIENALADVRRVAYNLRPPALDQMGLVRAIQAFARECERGAAQGQPPKITVDAPSRLPPLPAAVEVAAYHIAREGLANVLHHAQAGRCTVRLALSDRPAALRLTVSDDGRGPAGRTPTGVGLTAMRERAEELGGTFTIQPAAGRGTVITASLPLLSGRPQE
jgi:signal transduction histidine kinase